MYPHGVMDSEEEFLQLSGLQHFAFCRRQWALVHMEQLWAENFATTDGAQFHEKVHDYTLRESRGQIFLVRGMYVRSAALGVSGQCDMVEFRQDAGGVPLTGREGTWQPYPVEYKRGKPGAATEANGLQLCCQAMCLEEMLCCPVPKGALYYGEIHHREEILFTPDLRAKVTGLLGEMHDLSRRGYTPKVKPTKACRGCSLKELCLPALLKEQNVGDYLRKSLEDGQ